MAKVSCKGAPIVWDIAHWSGSVELDRRPGFEVGYSYKFLNGGPASASHIFVAEWHLELIDQPLAGWFSHAEPFRFDDCYRRADGIRRSSPSSSRQAGR